jgi:hypothetical protein
MSRTLSRKTATALAFLGLLTALNVGMLLFNTAQPSRAAVAGMKSADLLKDADFTKAVKAIAGKCKVNVELAKLLC